MRKAVLFTFFLIVAATLFAQKNGIVKGIAFDTISRQPVAAATVTVLEKRFFTGYFYHDRKRWPL